MRFPGPSDTAMRLALSSADSVRHAAKRLGISRHAVTGRCEKTADEKLRAEYEKCVRRSNLGRYRDAALGVTT